MSATTEEVSTVTADERPSLPTEARRANSLPRCSYEVPHRRQKLNVLRDERGPQPVVGDVTVGQSAVLAFGDRAVRASPAPPPAPGRGGRDDHRSHRDGHTVVHESGNRPSVSARVVAGGPGKVGADVEVSVTCRPRRDHGEG